MPCLPIFGRICPRMAREPGDRPFNRVLVISGEGKHFTSEWDLSAFQPIMDLSRKEPARGAFALRELILKLQDTFSVLEEIRIPVIAAIHGACLGGGIDFITACDIRLASEDAIFGIEEIHIGMTADVGTLQRLPKLIAPGIVRELPIPGAVFCRRSLPMGFGQRDTQGSRCSGRCSA